MVHKITCAANTNDSLLLQRFRDRLSAAGIKTEDLKSPDSRYAYLGLFWDDADTPIPCSQKQNRSNAGAKPKILQYDGKTATCGLVWQLRNQGCLSDADIAAVLDTSESTVARRRKKHMADSSFYKGSTAIF